MNTSAFKGKYVLGKQLGSGTYGEVYLAQKKSDGAKVAVKFYKHDGKDGKKYIEIDYTSLREASILRDLQHENIVKLREIIFEQNSGFAMIFEYCPKDLRSYIKHLKDSMKTISEKDLKQFSYQIIKGMDYLHANCILHRDLKPDNILLDENNNVKLADFGLARQLSQPFREYSNTILTLYYRAPELLYGETKYSIGVDMWSIACTLAELYLKEPLFNGCSEVDLLLRIHSILGDPSPSESAYFKEIAERKGCKLKDFPKKIIGESVSTKLRGAPPAFILMIEQMLNYNSDLRLTCAELLKHPYFK